MIKTGNSLRYILILKGEQVKKITTNLLIFQKSISIFERSIRNICFVKWYHYVALVLRY